MPKSHRQYAKWTPEQIIKWTAEIGPATAELAQAIIEARPHPQQGFRSCLGIIRLAKGYSQERVEAACRRALAIKALTYKSVQSILKNGLETQPLPQRELEPPTLFHDNIRGAEYFTGIEGQTDAG